MIQYIKISQNPSFGSRGRCFWQKLTFRLLVWPWIWGQGHQNLIISFPHPNNVSMPVWSNSPIGSEERVQTRSYADADRIRTKNTMPQLPFVFFVFLFFFFCLFVFFFFLFVFFFCFFFFVLCVWGGGAGEHNLALTDPVVSEKMFEECGRRHRRACLDDKLTNQYIKRSARIIRSKICRIKMTYTFEDAVKEDNQIECDFTGLLFLFQTSHTKKILKCDFALKRFWENLQDKPSYL